MTTGHVNLRHLILGLLTRKPMSGYDIKRFLKSLSWLMGSPSFGSLYPALRALSQNGLVNNEDSDPHQNKRSRKVYRITEAGKQALQECISQPATPDTTLKGFITRLILANSFPRAGLIAHLQQRRSQVAIHRAALAEMVDAPSEERELKERLALDYGLALAAAELAWLDNTLNRFLQPLPMEAVEGKSTALEA
jgi:PadR family transcriptional regulator AphA